MNSAKRVKPFYLKRKPQPRLALKLDVAHGQARWTPDR